VIGISPKQIRLKLAVLKDGETKRFSAKLAPGKLILVVAHKRSYLRSIAWNLIKPFIAGNILNYSLAIELKHRILGRYTEKIGLRVIK